MVTHSDGNPAGRRPGAWAAALGDQLAAARELLASGDTAEAERRAKAVSALAKAARDVAELVRLDRDEPEEDDVEQIRAELFARLAQHAAADAAMGLTEPPRYEDCKTLP